MDLDDFAAGLTNIDVTGVVSTVVPNNLLRQQELDKCQDPDENTLPCDHTAPYRTYNGWCNNLNNPQYGKSVTSLVRFLSAKYDDGKRLTLQCSLVCRHSHSVWVESAQML